MPQAARAAGPPRSRDPPRRPYNRPPFGMRRKRENGRFFTEGNPFGHPAFRNWAKSAGLPRNRVLEPFAGANGLIRKLGSASAAASIRSTSNRPPVMWSGGTPCAGSPKATGSA